MASENEGASADGQKAMRREIASALNIGAWACIVVGTGFIADGVSGNPGEETAGWIEASATVGALCAAIAAGRYVSRQLKIEQEREASRLETDQQAQASLVACWPLPPPVPEPSLDPNGPNFYPFSLTEIQVMIRNASQVPVTDIQLVCELRLGGEFRRSELVLDYLPPADSPARQFLRLEPPLEVEVPRRRERDDESWRVRVETSLDFTDSAGRRWERERSGLRLADASGD